MKLQMNSILRIVNFLGLNLKKEYSIIFQCNNDKFIQVLEENITLSPKLFFESKPFEGNIDKEQKKLIIKMKVTAFARTYPFMKEASFEEENNKTVLKIVYSERIIFILFLVFGLCIIIPILIKSISFKGIILLIGFAYLWALININYYLYVFNNKMKELFLKKRIHVQVKY